MDGGNSRTYLPWTVGKECCVFCSPLRDGWLAGISEHLLNPQTKTRTVLTSLGPFMNYVTLKKVFLLLFLCLVTHQLALTSSDFLASKKNPHTKIFIARGIFGPFSKYVTLKIGVRLLNPSSPALKKAMAYNTNWWFLRNTTNSSKGIVV